MPNLAFTLVINNNGGKLDTLVCVQSIHTNSPKLCNIFHF